MKICNKCGELKPLFEFYSKEKTNTKGEIYTYYRPDCKECTKRNAYKWRNNNPERHKELKKIYNEKPKTKLVKRKMDKKLRMEGKRKEWQRNNPDKVRGYNKDRSLHKKHEISKQEWIDCKEYFNNSCAYCGISENEAKETQGQYLHKEHVNHNGENDLRNCVPSCRSCNSKKNTFTLEEWYREDNELYEHYSFDRLQKIYKWLNEDYKKSQVNNK